MRAKVTRLQQAIGFLLNGRFGPQAVFKARMRPLDEKAVILTAMVESQLSA
jgi:hypothetical protein